MFISSLLKGQRANSIRALTASLLMLLLFATAEARAQATGKKSANLNSTARRATGALKVITGQPGSVVFINNVRHGATSDNGELDLPRVMAGSYPVRVRTVGYADWNGSVVVAAGGNRTLKVTQQPTTDQATLHYQKGDQLRESGKNKDAVTEYEQALALRPQFPEARIALAR